MQVSPTVPDIGPGVLKGWKIYSIQTFKVKVEGDDLLVKLSSHANLDRLHVCDPEVTCTCFA